MGGGRSERCTAARGGELAVYISKVLDKPNAKVKREGEGRREGGCGMRRTFLHIGTMVAGHVHYRTRLICRVPRALGKDVKALGKNFAESPTRQRALGEAGVGKGYFAESFSSGSRQNVYREPKAALGKEK
jgi:hypothetical protein